MPEENQNTQNKDEVVGVAPEFLCGRLDILSSLTELTPENVIAEVDSAVAFHNRNVISEDYLYWYRRGIQPILSRKKERNTYVLSKCLVNLASQVVDFKNGYFLQEDAKYTSRRNGVQRKIDKLNEFVFRSGKYDADNIVADWFHTVGKGVLYVEESSDNETPIRCYAVDPRSAFVVYSMRPGKKPLYGVNVVHDNDISLIDVYTDKMIYRLRGSSVGEKTTAFPVHESMAYEIIGIEENILGHIPIIEYRYNSVNMGSFENCCFLLDCINQVESGRVDGVEQFIQSVIVAVNCQFEEGTTADQIKRQGMILLSSVGENKADFKILSEELNQEQTQTLIDDLTDEVYQICAVPMTARRGHGTYDSTGQAAIFNNGWEQAFSACRGTEDEFRLSNRYFDEIVVDVVTRRKLIDNLKRTDFALNFVRNETANMQSKAQSFQTLLEAGLHPELAAKKSGISNDPVADIKMSEKYLKMVWGDPNAAVKAEEKGNGQGEAKVIEEDNNNGEDAVG